jgi:2-hydroxymuconate-semialdehyde hydrolase
MDANPEVGRSIVAGGIRTNYLQAGEGPPVLLIHGSGPGVSAWVNWRLNIEVLAERNTVYAPDVVGFGFTERPVGFVYDLDSWRAHLVGFVDALGLEKFSVVGNSFGGGMALALAAAIPDRVDKLVLMGAVGVGFKITEGLDRVWAYEPSREAMRGLIELFAFDPDLVSDEVAEARYQASIRPGFQESFARMFPAPRQGALDGLTLSDDEIRNLPHETLILHGRDDKVIPVANAVRLLELIDRSECHLFGRCGHWTQIEYAAQFNTLVGEFLAR